MALVETIRGELTAAVRSGDASRRDILRLLIAAFDNERIALGHAVSDAEAMQVLSRQAKQRRDSIEQYGVGGREDLAQAEQGELEVIESYLPAGLSDEQLRAAAEAVIVEVGAQAPGDLGKVMRPLMQRVAGRADGARVQALVRELLAAR